VNGKLNKNIGFSLLPFAFIFLFEPGYTLVDPLPDFIGYIIVCLAIINLADISPRIQEAYDGFRRGILISVLRFISVYLLDRYFADISKFLGLLIFCFIFSLFELIVIIPAYRNFFEGLLHLGMMHDGNAVYIKKINTKTIKIDGDNEKIIVKESRRNITENMYFLTVAFLFLRHTAMTLPEFTTLISNAKYEFISILRVFGIIIVLPIGVSWLIRFFVYCGKICKDKTFINELSEIYLKKVKENPNFYTARVITSGIYTILAAFAVSVDFYSKYINILPDYIFFILIFAAAILLRKFSRKWISLSCVSIVGIIISALSHYSSILFHSEFYPNAIRKNLEAYYSYYKMLGLHIAEAAVLIVAVIFIALLLWDIYKAHSDLSKATSVAETKEGSRRYKLGAIVTVLFTALSALGSVYYVAAQPFYYTDKWYFYYSAVISVALSLMFAFAGSYFVGFINNSVKYNYRLYI
jgi:hypothetical protein